MYRKITEDIVVVHDNSSDIEKLNGGVWLVSFDPEIGYHLVRQKDLELPSKIYGHNHEISDKIIDTFKINTGKTTGVMLQGVKGSGKTLTAIEVSKKLNAENVPVLLIQQEFFGTGFNNFMQSIDEPAVVLIDEFEKTYTRDDAISSMLMLLDGAIKTTKLFLLTSNSDLESNDKFQFLYNRPSRIQYVFKYSGISDEAMAEYLQDNLKFPNYTKEIVALKRSFYDLTIDMLKSIVSEINRFGDGEGKLKVADILVDLNVRTDRTIASYQYERTLILNGKRLDISDHMDAERMYEISPFKLEQILDYGDSSTITVEFHDSEFSRDEIAQAVEGVRTLHLKRQVRAGEGSSDHVKRAIANAIESTKNLSVPEFLKKHSIDKPFTDADIETINRKQHTDAQTVTKVLVRLWDSFIDQGEIKVSQDENSRAITFEFSPNFQLEFKPKISVAKKQQSFII